GSVTAAGGVAAAGEVAAGGVAPGSVTAAGGGPPDKVAAGSGVTAGCDWVSSMVLSISMQN
ncbi:MAG: hypothetical protein RBT28_10925, partial [Bacteroidales bacterium]|nr:hypothetical protein [Bacteroidales bacterium]